MAVVVALAVAGSARADSIDCNASWRRSTSGLCSGGTSGFEEIQMNFFGSQDASDSDVAFTPVNYYASYAPKAQTSTPTDFVADDLAGGGWVNPDPNPTSSTPGGNSGTALTNLSNVIPTSHVAASTFASLSDPPPDPAVVPEPANSALVVFGLGLMALLLRKGQQRGPRAL